MNKFLLIAAGLAVVGAANADVIASWTFETSAPTTAGPLLAEVGVGTALSSHASGATVYSSPVGNGSARSWSSNNWGIGDYFQFTVSTVGFTAITISWDQTSSNTGPRDFALQASINGGAYAPVIAAYVVQPNATPNPVWNSTTASAIYTVGNAFSAAYDNDATVSFRLVDLTTTSANGGVVGTAGTDRVDNFTVNGTSAVPEPATMAVLGLGILGIISRRRNRK